MKNYDNILVCGDIHCNLDIIPNYLRDFNLNNCAVIQVGDFGIGYETENKEKRRLNYLNDRLKLTNSKLFVIRGNHDNPAYFNNYEMSNLILLKDYSVIELNSKNILCVGGAVSADRKSRKGYLTWTDSMEWWTKEEFVYDQNKIKELRNIDIVVTHSAPTITYPFEVNYKESILSINIENDKVLLSDIKKERESLTKMWKELSINNHIEKWYHGHFHLSRKSHYENTTFIALNINEIKPL